MINIFAIKDVFNAYKENIVLRVENTQVKIFTKNMTKYH